jgi:hypothetical protein
MIFTNSTDSIIFSDNPVVVDSMEIFLNSELTNRESADAQTPPPLSSAGETFTDKGDELNQNVDGRSALAPREVSGKAHSIYCPGLPLTLNNRKPSTFHGSPHQHLSTPTESMSFDPG